MPDHGGATLIAFRIRNPPPDLGVCPAVAELAG